MDKNNLYDVLFNTAAEGLIVADDRGKILKVNMQAELLFGYEQDELTNKDIEVLIPKKHHERHRVHQQNYMSNPRKRSMGEGMDLAGVKKDGTVFPVEISLNYFISEDRKYAMVLITDITQRKISEQKIIDLNAQLEARVEERTRDLEKINKNLEEEIKDRKRIESELKESQNLYSIIARNFPNGTINVFDRELNYIFVEGKELYKLGITGDKLIGTKFTKRLEPTIAAKIETELADVFEGSNKTIELEYRNSHYVLFAVPLRLENGKIDRILVVETNISFQKQAEADIQLALEKEKELNELKSRFVSMASHEFRTPLSTILSSVTLIEKYRLESEEEKRKKHIYRIKAGVNNLVGILNDFLSLDKLEDGKISAQYSIINVTEIGRDLTEEMQAMAKIGQNIIYQHEGDSSEFVTDKQILRNILTNLLSNAIKYSEEKKEIIFTSNINKDELVFKVSDNGIGIPEKEQEHLFDRFFRASNVTNIQGTGLGLNIIKKYLDIIEGKIEFESEENKGTTFTIRLKNRSL